MSSLRVIELTNRRGDRLRLLDLGARICSLELQLQSGKRNVVLAYPGIDDYIDEPNYLGCTIGRYANRIGRASFVIGGCEYRLSANQGIHHLHGGADGFDRKQWKVVNHVENRSVTFELESPDGDQGYPGSLRATAQFDWTDDRELSIALRAETDAPTHVNLTNHAYFNLDGRSADVLQQLVSVASDRLVAVDRDMIPTGQLLEVDGSALDFRRPTRLQDALASGHEMVVAAGGVDFSYVLKEAETHATARSSNGDLELSLVTSCPALHLYTGQNLVPPFGPFAGFCLEPQYLPDSPNHANFPRTLLEPGMQYSESTQYRFAEAAS